MNLKQRVTTLKLGQTLISGNKNPAVQDLIRALAQSVGNKVYLRDLEVLLDKIEMSRVEQEVLYYLIRDLRSLK